MRRRFNGLKYYLIFWLAVSASGSALAQSLSTADSLFTQRKYTEAFQQYERLHQQGQVTPAMLLKMAYIKEGLSDFAGALYYLNLHARLTADEETMAKMRRLAERHQLKGYAYNDQEYLVRLLKKYRDEIQWGLLGCCFILSVVIFWESHKGRKPAISLFFNLLFLAGLLVLNNGWTDTQKAIIMSDTTLMTAASAAAEPLEAVRKGHKVQVLQRGDVWTKVRWEGKEAYVRNAKVVII
jgi:hypothetical protein